MQDIFKATFHGSLVGFFPATSWSQAAKAGAAAQRKVTGESVPWEHVMATWVNPKHYDQEGVPSELYATSPDEAAATA